MTFDLMRMSSSEEVSRGHACSEQPMLRPIQTILMAMPDPPYPVHGLVFQQTAVLNRVCRFICDLMVHAGHV